MAAVASIQVAATLMSILPVEVLMINRILLSTFSILCLGQAVLAQNYLSVAVMLPAHNTYQLQSALKSFNKMFPKVESDPITKERLHMTLINLHIQVQDGLSKELKNLIKERVEGILKQSVKEHLRWVNHPLTFEKITTFNNKIVATYTLDEPCNKLISALEKDVSDDATVKVWTHKGIIKRIRHAHAPIVLHVSLATITKSDQGYSYIHPRMSPFVVRQHNNWITAYWNGSENKTISKIPYKIIGGALVGIAVMIYVMKKYW